MIKRVFYFSYVDRYSLIALGTHYPLILVYQWLGLENKYLIAFCVLAIMPEVILCTRYYARSDLDIQKIFSILYSQKDL